MNYRADKETLLSRLKYFLMLVKEGKANGKR